MTRDEMYAIFKDVNAEKVTVAETVDHIEQSGTMHWKSIIAWYGEGTLRYCAKKYGKREHYKDEQIHKAFMDYAMDFTKNDNR